MRIETFLAQSPVFAITRAARRFEQATVQQLAGDGLGLLDGLVLAAIYFDGAQAARPSQLAETFATSRGNLSHCVSALEAKGLIGRTIDPTDARSFRLTLRPAGKRVAQRVISVFERTQRAFEHEIGKTQLAETLATVRRLETLAES